MAAQDQQSFLPADAEEENRRVASARGAIAKLGLQSRVSRPMVLLLLYLDRYGSKDDEQPGCRARLKTLKDYLDRMGEPTAIRTLQKYLRALREAGLVELSRRDGLPVNRVIWPGVRELARSSSNGAHETAATKGARPRANKSGASSRQSGASSRQSGASSRQSGAPSKQPSKQLSKPPSSQGAPLRVGSWEEEEEKLLNLGMAMAQDALARVSARQVSLGEVQALIAFWESMQPAWGIGALWRSLLNLRPGMVPEAMPWPPKSDEWVRQQRKTESGKRQQSLAEERAALEAQEAADRARMESLESRHGEMLDGLSDEEYRDLVEQVKPGLATMLPHSLRTNQIVRGIVLEKISQKLTELSFRLTQRVER